MRCRPGGSAGAGRCSWGVRVARVSGAMIPCGQRAGRMGTARALESKRGEGAAQVGGEARPDDPPVEDRQRRTPEARAGRAGGASGGPRARHEGGSGTRPPWGRVGRVPDAGHRAGVRAALTIFRWKIVRPERPRRKPRAGGGGVNLALRHGAAVGMVRVSARPTACCACLEACGQLGVACADSYALDNKDGDAPHQDSSSKSRQEDRCLRQHKGRGHRRHIYR